MPEYYKIFFSKLVLILIPPGLRKTRIIAMISAMNSWIHDIYGQWYAYYFEIEYKIKINSQICFLRKAINDSFDYTSRRITIDEGQRYERLYIFNDSENKPKFLPVILQDESIYADSGFDFIVNTHGLLASMDEYSVIRLKQLIDENKLVGKRYKII